MGWKAALSYPHLSHPASVKKCTDFAFPPEDWFVEVAAVGMHNTLTAMQSDVVAVTAPVGAGLVIFLSFIVLGGASAWTARKKCWNGLQSLFDMQM